MAFDSTYEDLIAPYQQEVDKLRSPYATMSANSWLAKKHPLVASYLDNAFLTAAMTPGPRGPEGAGGAISRTFQGLMGAQQFQHQKQLEDLMLPLQLAQSRLQAEHTLAQINQEQAYADYLKQHGQYLGQEADINQQKADIAKQRADQAEEARYGGKLDPSSKLAVDQVMKKYGAKSYSDLNADQLQEAQKAARMARVKSGNFSQSDIIAMQMSDDPDVKAKGEQAARIWSSMYGMAAGARTSAEQNVPHPYSEQSSFLQNERQKVYSKLAPILPYKDYISQYGDPILGEIPSDTSKGAMTGPTPNQLKYQQYVDKAKMDKQKADFNWSQYERWAQEHPGMGYEESPWGSHPQTESSPASAVTSGGNSNWTPK